jgi:hypothetical protein
MTSADPRLVDSAKHLRAAVRRETELARRGAITALHEAADAKRTAFAEFRAACQAWPPDSVCGDADRDALRALLTATDENANVLEAVRATLEGFTAGLRAALEGSVDPGTYGPHGRGRSHMPAARIDASA